MIGTILCLMFLSGDYENAKRIQSTLYDANRIISQCDELDQRCSETVEHAKLFDDLQFRVRTQVSSVTADKNGRVIVIGTIRPVKRDLNEYRTEREKERIGKSIKSKRQNVGQDSDWIRRRNIVHRNMMKELDRVAKQRRRKAEFIDFAFHTDKYQGQDLVGLKHIDLVVFIDDFEIRKGVPAIGVSPAIGKLAGTILHADVETTVDTPDAIEISISTAGP